MAGESARVRWTCGALVAAVVGLSTSAARAQPEYPGLLQEALGMQCPAPCKMCHTNPYGGGGWNRFGMRVLEHSASGALSWPSIVDKLRAGPDANGDVDSDGDLTPDVAELEMGADPSQAGTEAMVCPTYGCGARIVKAPTPEPLGVLAALAAAVLLSAARRSLRRPPR